MDRPDTPKTVDYKSTYGVNKTAACIDINRNSLLIGFEMKNIAKGTTDPRVEFILQVLTQILIKFHLQNLE